MLKVLLPFLDSSMQKNIAVYIKFCELQYTMSLINNPSIGYSYFPHKNTTNETMDFDKICDQLLPYCNLYQKQQFTQIRNFFQTMNNMKDMMDMFQTMKELFPEGAGNSSQDGFNPEIFSTISNLFGGSDIDLSSMMNMFSGNT